LVFPDIFYPASSVVFFIAPLRIVCGPTFHLPAPGFLVFPEADHVLAVEPSPHQIVSAVALHQAFSLAAGSEVVFAVADLQVVSGVAQPEVFPAAAPEAVSAVVELRTVFPATDPKAFFFVSELPVFFAAVEPEVVPEVVEPPACSVVAVPQVVVAQSEVSVVAQHEVFAAADPEAVFAVAQLQVAFGVVAPEAVAFGIAFAFVVLTPASVAVAGADSSGRPRFFVFPNVDHFASFSSSVEVDGGESVHSPTGAHTNYGLCNIFSSQDLHHNRNLGHCCNNSNPGYNTVIDTNDLPMDATTSHPRKTSLSLSQGQHKHHLHQGSRSHPEVLQTRLMVARNNSRLHLGCHNPVRQGCSNPGETETTR